MRRWNSIAHALAIFALFGFAMGQAKVADLLQSMQSSNVDTRMDAFYQLYAIPHAIDRPGVGAALVKLLTREEAVYESDAPFVSGEGFANYIGVLADAVLHYVQTTGDLAPLPLLVVQPSGPGSIFEVELAKFGDKLLPSLKAVEAGSDPAGRQTALDIAGVQLSRDRSGTQPLPDARADLKALIVAGAKDPDHNVRFSATQALHRLADPADLPLLEKLEASDPDPSVREQARRAAKAIETPHE